MAEETQRESELEAARLHKSNRVGLFEKGVDLKPFSLPKQIAITPIQLIKVNHLSESLGDLPLHKNRFARTKHGAIDGHQGYNQSITPDEFILMDIVRKSVQAKGVGLVRAGPRAQIVWGPGEVKAAIVTCGGLCPGLNAVICELVKILYWNYGVDDIYGIRMGFRGFYDPELLPYKKLTPEVVDGISEIGGTVLGSSRGGFDLDKIVSALLQHKINQVYVIGGDGTHRAANKICSEVHRRKLKISVVGIPKTIDNDIGLIDKSFGFDTAVEEAEKAIKSVRIEARCAKNGIGVVKLMGRSSGFIAAYASLASRDVDLVLIPEVHFEMEGARGILPHIERSLRRQGHCVIVVAEGAGQHLFKNQHQGTDPSGNPILFDAASLLRTHIKRYFSDIKMEITLKFNDPSYMIRSVPANAADSVYCIMLAQNAVHGAMAGYTNFVSGLVNARTVYIPIDIICKASPTYLNPLGRTWERVISSTHQPRTQQLKSKL
eukprot:TRINITY_DN6053_c0_g1_i1.p1 TRINITY_DN6053_c0_g1~~TRINITY_DN6053_c0_g1_i1.p1  ORF type:complete len:519 (-),score=191.53 TRINITY_DN6053_c0_g1_i1:90-1562(-)